MYFNLLMLIAQFDHLLNSLFCVCFYNIGTILFELVLLSLDIRVLVNERQYIQCYPPSYSSYVIKLTCVFSLIFLFSSLSLMIRLIRGIRSCTILIVQED